MWNHRPAAVSCLNTSLLLLQLEAGKGPQQQRTSSSRREGIECNKPILMRPIELPPPLCMRLSCHRNKALTTATAAARRAPLLLLLLLMLLLQCCFCVQLEL